MKLPNREDTYIQPQKLTRYLLSETHTVGRSKAKLFRAFGFNEQTVNMLEQELLEIAHTQEVQEMITTPHGVKYVVDGEIQTPQARTLRLQSVWIIDVGQKAPRFVTARPLKPDPEEDIREPEA